ncbi:30S ribosomal protein S20 [Patescibacteria group bacterium]|nr:30S ribosomal protein S20 [Patescibacteria group bacterium]
MPNLQSAKKALRQNVKRAEKNLKSKVEVKKLLKDARKAVEAGDNKAEELLKQAGKKLDKIAKTGYFKKNKVSRLKSRLAKKLNASKKTVQKTAEKIEEKVEEIK